MIEQRKIQRYKTGGVIRIVLSDYGQELIGNILNLSTGGIQFFLSRPLPVRRVFRFHVDIDEMCRFSGSGMVVYVKSSTVPNLGDGYLAGLQFGNINMEDMDKIKQHINYLSSLDGKEA